MYDESDVVDLLEIDMTHMDVKYGMFTPEEHVSPSPTSTIDLWISLYDSRCASPTASKLCEALFFNLGTQNHYTLDANNRWQLPGTTETPTTVLELTPDPEPVLNPANLSTTIFLDDFEEDKLNNWNNAGRYSWEVGDFDESVHPQERNNTNNVISADRCISQCVLTIKDPVDVSSENRTVLTFHRYVDQSLDSGEYLRVEVTNGNGTWIRLAEWMGNSGDDDDRWHFERFDVTDHISDAFQVRFAAHMSSSSEDVGIDDVMISRVLEFYGGNNYTMFFTEHGIMDNVRGTITIGATNSSSGAKGILTAGHILSLESTQVFHNHTVGNDLVLLNRNPDGYYNTVRIDAAFIPIEDPNVIIKNRIQTLNGTIMNVTYGDLSDTPRWSKVNIYGAINNDDGWLLFKNATLALGMRTVSNMGVATYDSKMGDSGAAIIHHNATGSHNLIGLHSGGVCVFNSPSEGQLPMINVTSSRFCDGNNDVYYYKIFSAWENVLSVLNIK